MADIGVFHPYLDTRGGGEACCMRTLEALQDDHDLTIYTLNDPDMEVLNSQFNTTVSHVSHRSLGIRGRALRFGGDIVRQATNQPTRRLQAALSYSYIDNRDHDLIISTYNEFGFENNALLYIDFPNFGPRFESEPESAIERVYGSVCNIVHRGTADQIRDSTLLTNSGWSANVIEDLYAVRPQVVHPPVDTAAFDPWPWENREDGFVAIGRADRVKRPLAVMDVFERVLEQGHDVHLHWVGTVGEDDYGQRVRERAATIDAVTLEGWVSFDELTEMVSSHKYGLHGRVNEHFGIAVAELLAGGTIPFVHDSGGPREIVGGSERLTYRSTPEAVSKIDALLSDPSPETVRDDLPDAKATFGLERFRRDIGSAVDRALEGN